MLVMEAAIITCPGTLLGPSLPNRPKVLLPHEYTLPWASNASECAEPAAIAVSRLCANASIANGIRYDRLVPVPAQFVSDDRINDYKTFSRMNLPSRPSFPQPQE